MLLTIRQIEVCYGTAQALKGVSLEIEAGEIVVVLGANGSGKTTLLKTVSGLLRPEEGTIEFEGKRLDRLNPEQIVKLRISHCPEGRKLFPEMQVLKNLHLGAYIRRREKDEIKSTMEMVLQLFPVLRERINQLAGTLSGGEQQMLAIGRALMSNPRLLMLDEPSLGLAPMIISRIFDVVREICNQGKTILLVEQKASEALKISHRGYVMESGSVVLAGEKSQLLNDDRVKRAYLGM